MKYNYNYLLTYLQRQCVIIAIFEDAIKVQLGELVAMEIP